MHQFETASRRAWLVLPLLLCTSLAFTQPKYRTFSQADLAEKAVKAGKILGARGDFRFINTFGVSAVGLHIKFNAPIVALDPNLGAAAVISHGGKQLDVDGTFADGETVMVGGIFNKKNVDIRANYFWGDGSLIVPKGTQAATASPILQQPNGGSVFAYLYKKIIKRPDGLTVGVPNQPGMGWIRYTTADRKVFPHTGNARCLDMLMGSNGTGKAWTKLVKNPHVNKYDNHMLGELHALKLAILANDVGVTAPDTPAVRLGDLLYTDTSAIPSPLSGKTLRALAAYADTMLSFCGVYGPDEYAAMDSALTRVNRSFDGPYHATSFAPFWLDGTHAIGESVFLQPNPGAPPGVLHNLQADPSILGLFPDNYALEQNFPNPFNPTTTINWFLPEASVVTLKVYNLLGQEVATLVASQPMDEGDQTADFDASRLTSGVYFYRLTAQSTGESHATYTEAKRMVFIK